MNERLVTTVFVPKNFSSHSSENFLFGDVFLGTNRGPGKEHCVCNIVLSSSGTSLHEEPIGTFSPSKNEQKNKRVWVILEQEPHLTVSSIKIHGNIVCQNDINIVFFEMEEFIHSELLTKKYLSTAEQPKTPVSFFIENIDKVVQKERQISKLESGIAWILLMLTSMQCLVKYPRRIALFLKAILENKLRYSSSVVNQLVIKLNQLEKLREECRKKCLSLLAGRIVVMITFDILAGIYLANYVGQFASLDDLYQHFSQGTRYVASNVQVLLKWLEGAPAGLKLNQPQAHALALFFSYHIHLWTLYLDLADPVLRGLTWVLKWIGVFGASLQIAIVSDLIELATLHLYCFYIYAARIHMVQIGVLGSQWRAFRGKKWNPLKKRIDTYVFSDGPFTIAHVLTPVVFTLALFLLPTTTVFYTVFMTIRLALYCCRQLFDTAIWLLNVNPVYFILLRLKRSSRVRGNLHVSTNSQPEKKLGYHAPLYLKLESYVMPLREILSLQRKDDETFSRKPLVDWKYIITSILYGENLL